MLGHSRGVGTMRADSPPALKSLLDWLLAVGYAPLLATYVDDAVHWRITVIGERGVGCYRNVTDPGDFRTSATLDPAHYAAEPPPALGALAIAATRALRLEFAGVDILEHPSGRLYVLEANFPCYFAQAQQAIGVDIAGAMLDHLMAKAVRLKTPDGAAG
jgi:glutathione synthase/RimK-type ligase-like ATP-grasp enzyme